MDTIVDDENANNSKRFQSLDEQDKRQQNDNDRRSSSSFQSMNDDEAHYRTIFQQLDPNDELKLGSRPSSQSKIRTIEQDEIERENSVSSLENQTTTKSNKNDD